MKPLYQQLFNQYADLVTQAQKATGTPYAIEEYEKVVAFEQEIQQYYPEFEEQGLIVGDNLHRKRFMDSLNKLAVYRGMSEPENVSKWDKKIQDYIPKGFQPARIIPKNQSVKRRLPVVTNHRRMGK